MRSISLASAGIPSTPVIGTATAGDASATVAFTPSTYLGKGGTVTYEVISSPSNLYASGSTSPISIGLVNGTSYTFTVRAVTDYGVVSSYSSSSNAVTPVAAPAPTPPGPPVCNSCAPQPWPQNCSYVSITCDPDTATQLSYMYYDCGCSQTCAGTGGYNQALRDGYCGYVAVQTQVCTCSAGSCVDNGCGGLTCYDNCGNWCSDSGCVEPVNPCSGYVCQAVTPATGCFKYDFIDCASPLPQCTYFGVFYGAYYFAYGDCNCNCPATFAQFQYCMGVASC